MKTFLKGVLGVFVGVSLALLFVDVVHAVLA